MPCNGITVAQLQFNKMVEGMLAANPEEVKERIRTLIEREFNLSIDTVSIRNNEIILRDYSYSSIDYAKIQKRVNQFVNDLSGYWQQDKALKYFEGKFKITKPSKDQNNSLIFFVSFPLRAKVKISVKGKIEIITQEGNFEDGKTAIEGLLKQLNNSGFKVNLASPYEQHRHDTQVNQQTLMR